jgi:hypothetical protein
MRIINNVIIKVNNILFKGINNDPAFMHYVPDFTYDNSNSYYTPMLEKMPGYTQYPYKLKSQQLPAHLNKHT